MKIFYILISYIFITNIFSNTTETPNNLEVIKNSPFLSYSAEFIFKEKDKKKAKIIREGLATPRYYYDLYDENSNHIARGVTRFFSLGLLNPYLMDIDVYNSNLYLGNISGKIIKRSRAKFMFYDENGINTAIAYLDAKKPDFIIVSAKNETEIIAKLIGSVYGDVCVVNIEFVKNNSDLDPKLLKIFTAFVSDFYEKFLEPPKQIHHYHTTYNTTYRN
ncbi:MAG: hypothetical protein K1060chlam5_00984 [Candidatus Anoxychlamydiales bacterium]|nr:hypothetical protein [Candidatus Anoxychlamydiales bacterium]